MTNKTLTGNSRPWPTCPVYECATCGREANANTLNYDEYEGCYWCSEEDGGCQGKMKWIRDDPAEFISIALYETHRVYGGPEEGGWWYDAGAASPMTIRNFPPEHWGTDDNDAGHAQWYLKYLQRQADEWNEQNRKDRSTELRYHATFYVNETAPGHFPAQRPVYS